MEKCWDDPGVHLMVGFNGLSVEEELKAIVQEFHIGGIVLFSRNIESPQQVQLLLAEAQHFSLQRSGRPLRVAIDQEGGPVQRLTPPYTQLPSARIQGMGGIAEVEKWQSVAAAELKGTGIHVNFAPVLDLVPSGENRFMEERSLGSDPLEVADLGAAWIRALQNHGVSATGKHFPGLGRAEVDPHHHAPVIHWQDRQTMERDLIPFTRAIQAGVHCMMTSHARYPLLDPDHPATLSTAVNRSLLRETLEFHGILFSDDMDMAAVAKRYSWEDMVQRGFSSGIDFFLLCQNSRNIEPFYRAFHKALSLDSALRQIRRESVKRIIEFHRIHSASETGGSPSNKHGCG